MSIFPKTAKTQKDIQILNDYLGSDDWKTDFAADEAGLLSADLKRGVLSEDGIWNLLKIGGTWKSATKLLSITLL